jgi:hypothetical protein
MSVGVKRYAAVLAAVVIAGTGAGVGTAIANRTADRSGRMADVAVHRTVLRDATGAVVGVVATATLAPASHAATLARDALAPETASGYAATRVAIARRGGRMAVTANRGGTERAPATAYRGDGTLRLGRLVLPAGARLTWALSGHRAAGRRTS